MWCIERLQEPQSGRCARQRPRCVRVPTGPRRGPFQPGLRPRRHSVPRPVGRSGSTARHPGCSYTIVLAECVFANGPRDNGSWRQSPLGPARRHVKPRAGWAVTAKAMHEAGDDRLLDEPAPTRFDETHGHGRAVACIVLTLSLTAVCAAGGQPAAPSATAIPDALRAHLRGERFSPLTTVAALPAGLRQALNKLFGGKTLDMADPGAPFQATDVMVTPACRPAGSQRQAARRITASSTTSAAASRTSTSSSCSKVRRGPTASSKAALAPGGLADLDAVKDARHVRQGAGAGSKYWYPEPSPPGVASGGIDDTSHAARPLRPLRRMLRWSCVAGLLLPALRRSRAGRRLRSVTDRGRRRHRAEVDAGAAVPGRLDRGDQGRAGRRGARATGSPTSRSRSRRRTRRSTSSRR